MFISHFLILHSHFAPGGRGQNPPLERKARGREIAERKRGKGEHTLPAKLTASPAEEGRSLNGQEGFLVQTDTYNSDLRLTVTCNGHGTFYYLKMTRKGTRYLSFYSGAEEKIPSLRKLREIDGDKK